MTPIRRRSDRLSSEARRGYAVDGWPGSTWRFQIRFQHAPGIISTPTPQPLGLLSNGHSVHQPYPTSCDGPLCRLLGFAEDAGDVEQR